MISRVAETCFWLHRYMERAENTARLVQVNRTFLLDVNLPDLERWHPLIVVSGERQRFAELFPAAAAHDAEVVQQYLTWGERDAASILSSVYWARENARAVRDVTGAAAWETLNAFWHWLRGGPGRRLYRRDRDAFYQRVRDAAALYQGVCQSTMLHEQAFDFMRLGMLLERAGQTARLLDVKHHMLGPTRAGKVEMPVETAQWMALLRTCSATESFLKHARRAPSGPAVVKFLLLEERFPRSVLHSLDRAGRFLRRVQPDGGAPPRSSAALLDGLLAELRARTPEQLLASGIHEELTQVIDETAHVCDAIDVDYFNPSFDDDAEGAAATTAERGAPPETTPR